DADSVSRCAVARPLVLEVGDLLTEDVLRRGDRFEQRRVDLLLDRRVLPSEVDEGDLAHADATGAISMGLPPASREALAASSTATTDRPRLPSASGREPSAQQR